jgi:hypothetical protein
MIKVALCSVLVLPAVSFAAEVGTESASALSTGRYDATIVQLENGQVLVMGGADGTETCGSLGSLPCALSSAELLDPDTGSVTATGDMTVPRMRAAAVKFRDASGVEQVLVCGGMDYDAVGYGHDECDLYDTATGEFSAADAMPVGARWGHRLTLLPDDTVLMTGGRQVGSAHSIVNAALYDPTADTWTSLDDLADARYAHTANVVVDESGEAYVVVAGGRTPSAALASVEIYTVSDETWTTADSLGAARSDHTASTLPGGQVLFVGGETESAAWSSLSSAELFDIDAWSSSGVGVSSTGAMREARAGHSTIPVPGGILVVGGHGSDGEPLDTAEIYNLGSFAAGEFRYLVGSAGILHVDTPVNDVGTAGGAFGLVQGGVQRYWWIGGTDADDAVSSAVQYIQL